MIVLAADPHVVRDVERSLASVYARDRLTEALQLVLVDSLTPSGMDLADATQRAWLRDALARPLERVTDAALQALVEVVTTLLAEAPTSLVDRLEQGRRWRDLGYGSE